MLLAVLFVFAATRIPVLAKATGDCTAPVCILPSEATLCDVGWLEVCESAVCYDSNSLCNGLSPEEQGFFALCSLFMFTQDVVNCAGDISKRDCGADCYGGQAIDVAAPVRGNCEAGGCCNPTLPLCELEKYFFFMSLGYGVSTPVNGNQKCSSSFDSFGPDHGCVFLTDGLSNDAIVCEDAGITHDEAGRNYCDITFSPTNDILDIIIEATNFAPAVAPEQVYGEGNNSVWFTPFEIFRRIAEGDPQDETDGILDIAFKAALDKGCFTRSGAAVHLVGHSLAASLTNLFALKLAALFPEVHVKMTTMGEPATFAKPLKGRAANIQAWSNKSSYTNGRVLPRSEVLYGQFSPRPYGLYQDYCPIAQLVPGGFKGENDQTKRFFLCEILEGNALVYFIAGPEGCADGRSDVLDDFPSFPHPGGLEFFTSDAVQDFVNGIKNDDISDFFDFLNIIFTIADINIREDFGQILDLHFVRRSMHLLGKLYSDGQDCSANRRIIQLPAV